MGSKLLTTFLGHAGVIAISCAFSYPNTALADEQNSAVAVETVLVTAEKKTEQLQDVPMPVTVLAPQSLADTDQVRLQDYAYSVPGLDATTAYHNHLFLTIRGINTGGVQAPTVGIMIDDLPFGAAASGLFDPPDIDPGDLDRIEVLRGPQGTLYGASSMGGLIKFVTKDPSFDSFSGRVEAGANDVTNGNEPGSDVRGSANVPITDNLAMRVSAFVREDPGYIDNPIRNLKGVNEGEAYGTRLSLLWKPLEDLSVKIAALYQDEKRDGSSDVQALPGFGDLQQNYLPGIGGFNRVNQAYSANVNYKLGNVDLTSVTGYSKASIFDTMDFDYAGKNNTPLFGIPSIQQHLLNETRKFSQEVRGTTSLWGTVDLLVGGFYTHEVSDAPGGFFAPDPATGQLISEYDFGNEGTDYIEYAGFANLDFHITEQFDIQIGGRESHNEVVLQDTINNGPINGGFSIVPGSNVSADVFTYLIAPEYRFTPDLMMYARISTGYRPGGSNEPAPAGIPPAFGPDKTKNYEIGAKADFFDHKLFLDGSLYYIDWDNIQFHVTQPGTGIGYNGNAGSAKSEGIELSATVEPLEGLSLSGWIDYDNAVITKAAPGASVFVAPGVRLPYSSEFSGNLSANQEFNIWNNLAGFVGATANFVGDRIGIFQPTSLRQVFPAYTKVDLKAGVKEGSWIVTVYANNVGDERGMLDGGIGYAPGSIDRLYIQPRTVGVTLATTF